MPRIETVFRVFVASPSDVSEERAIVGEVIAELNTTWSKQWGVRLEPIRWETHAVPGIGTDPQAVVNASMGDDYDIFIGILWTHFGTPTPRAASGTEEEFQRAYRRYEADPHSVAIMIYFKTAPLAPSEIDPDQLRRINEFRNKLGNMGILYGTFADREDFATLLRVHLSRQVQSFLGDARAAGATAMLDSARAVIAPSPTDTSSDTTIEDEEEAGFLDLVQTGFAGFQAMTNVMQELTAETQLYNERITERTKEMELAVKSAPDDPRPMWLASNHAADDMDAFAKEIETRIPVYAGAAEDAFSSLAGAVTLLSDFNSEDSGNLKIVLQNLKEMNATITTVRGRIAAFRNTVAQSPRITTKFNRARRNLTSVLDRLLGEFERSQNLAAQVEQMIEGIGGGDTTASDDESPVQPRLDPEARSDPHDRNEDIDPQRDPRVDVD